MDMGKSGFSGVHERLVFGLADSYTLFIDPLFALLGKGLRTSCKPARASRDNT